MKTLLILVFFLLHFCLLQAQVLNSSFEDWDSLGTTPIHWQTNHIDAFVRVQRDSASRTGNFAARIISISDTNNFTECVSRLWAKIPYLNDQSELILSFWHKSAGTYFSTNLLSVDYFNNGEKINSQGLFLESETGDYSLKELQLLEIEADSIKIEFVGGSYSEPANPVFCIKRPDIIIDDISINFPSAISLDEKLNILAYPNPTSTGIVHFNNLPSTNINYTVRNNNGQLIQDGKLNDSFININATGIFFVQLTSDSMNETFKMISN